MSYQDDQSALPESLIENYSSLAYDLTSIYQIKTYDELKDVLDANMARLSELIEVVAPVSSGNTGGGNGSGGKTRPVAAPAAVKPASKVTTRFDDVDTDEDEVVASAVTARLQSSDDDFYNEADAILNS
jgi:hypothetical protein